MASVAVAPLVESVASATILRRILKVGKAHTQLEGAGFEVRRPFPSRAIPDSMADPFLLLDEFGPVDREAGGPGAPWHPHRGFDTVTYLKAGESAHQDSMGNSGRLVAGEVQWMRAGAGVIHDEGRDHPGGLSHGFQIWVNLPQALKMSPPMYQQLSAETFVWTEYPSAANHKTKVKVIAGELPCSKSPLELSTPVLVADIVVERRGRAQILVPADLDTAIFYVYGGEGRAFDGADDKVGSVVRNGDFVVFQEPEESLRTTRAATFLGVENSGDDELQILLLSGKKLREPIARAGPFVMNTEAELEQAYKDYRAGTLAQVKGISHVY